MNWKRASMAGLLVVIALALTPLAGYAQAPQSFTSADGSLTFDVPDGWAVQEFVGTIFLANSQAALDSFGQTGAITSGQAYIALVTPGGVADEIASYGGDVREGPLAVLNAVLSTSQPGVFGTPETLTIGDRAVARVVGDAQGQTSTIYTIDLGEGGIALLALIAVSGEQDQFTASAEVLIGSMTATPLALPEETGSVVWQFQQEFADSVGSGEFGSVTDVAVGPDDTLYVLDSASGIHVLGPDGTERSTLGSEQFVSYGVALAVAPDDTLWMLDFTGDVVHLDASGAMLGTFSLDTVAEVSFVQTNLAVGPDGSVYVLNPRQGAADSDQSGIVFGDVLVFDPDGNLLRTITIGQGDQYFSADLAFGPDGNLYTLENYGENGIKVFDSAGTLLREGIAASTAYGATWLTAAPDGSFYVAAPNGPIRHLSADGQLVGRFGEIQLEAVATETAQAIPPFEPGQFFQVVGVAALSNGDVVVADSNGHYVQVVRLAFAP